MSQLIDISLKLACWLAYNSLHVPSSGFATSKLISHLSDHGSLLQTDTSQETKDPTCQTKYISGQDIGSFFWASHIVHIAF